MRRQAVESSNIVSIGYDPKSQTLEIEFNNSGIYQYFDVPQTVYEALMSSGSKGSFFAANIKGSYRYARV